MVVAKSVLRDRPSRPARGLFRLPLLALAVLALAAFAADAGLTLGQAPSVLDVGFERWVQSVSWGPLVAPFFWIDWLEGVKQVAAAGLGLLAVLIWNRRGFLLMAWGALSGAVYQVIEMTTRRPRPEASLVHVFRHTSGWSFPSGHAIFFTWFGAYLLLTLGGRLPRPLRIAGWVALGAVLAVVAVGRVYTAEHWPSDVLAGLCLGAAWTLFGLSIRRLSDPVLDG